MSLLGSIAKSIPGIGQGYGAYEDAKNQQKAIKAQAEAKVGVISTDTAAQIAAITADSAAQQAVIGTDSAAKQRAALYEAGVEDQNAAASRLLGADALARGRLNEDTLRRQAGQAEGTVRTQIAGTGVDVNRGSAVDLQRDVYMATDLDALAIQQDAAREKYGQDLGAYDAEQRAALGRMEAASTAEVAAANIKGIQDTSAVRKKGIQSTSDANIKGIKNVADKNAGAIDPITSGLSATISSGMDFATRWYMMG
jgi:carbon monoxide dehydrogenase subunit G